MTEADIGYKHSELAARAIGVLTILSWATTLGVLLAMRSFDIVADQGTPLSPVGTLLFMPVSLAYMVAGTAMIAFRGWIVTLLVATVVLAFALINCRRGRWSWATSVVGAIAAAGHLVYVLFPVP